MSGMMNGDEEYELLRCLKGHVIKTYKNGKFTDLAIKAKDNVEVRGHKLILYAQNAWFARKLDSSPDVSEISVPEFNGEIMRTVVDSIYYRKMDNSILSKDNVMDFLKAGDMFYIDNIRDEASIFMAKNLDVNYALDMITKPIFNGSISDNALDYIAENFGDFLSNDTLKKRLLTEINPSKFAEILSQKNVMLRSESGHYLPALDREKQLFFLALGYVAKDKENRLQHLKMLLTSLKMCLLVSKNIANIHVMAAGLKAPVEEISGLIADVLEPYENLSTDQNMSTLWYKNNKDKSKSTSSPKPSAESCKMRFGSIAHQCTCSDLALVLEPWSQIKYSKYQYAPLIQLEKVTCGDARMTSITVFKKRKLKKPAKNASQETESAGEKSTEKTCKTSDGDDETEGDKNSNTDKEKDSDESTNEKTEKKEDDSSSEQSAGKDKTSEKDAESEKEKSTENTDGLTEKVNKEAENSSESGEKEGLGGEWWLCGLRVTSAKSSSDLGITEGDDVSSEEYKLEPKEFITLVKAHYPKDKVQALNKRGREKEIVAQEMFGLTTVEDLSFETNLDRELGPISAGSEQLLPGLEYRLPKQIFRLEKGSPSNFWWLQGFGLEKVKLDGGEKETGRFFPIWKFQSSNKYYPSEYQGIEFVAGVKKQFQCSIDGIEECLSIESIQDLNTLERTPVHEVVELDDEDSDGGGCQDNSDEDADGDGDETREENGQPNIQENEDSVMIVDSDSSMGDMEREEDHLGRGEDEDDEEEEEEYQQGVLQHEMFGGYGHGQGGPITTGLGGVEEPIEIPSSSDEEEEQPMPNGLGVSEKRKHVESTDKSPKRKR